MIGWRGLARRSRAQPTGIAESSEIFSTAVMARRGLRCAKITAPGRSLWRIPAVSSTPVRTQLIFYAAGGVLAAVLAAAVPWFQDGLRVLIPFVIGSMLAGGAIRLSESKNKRDSANALSRTSAESEQRSNFVSTIEVDDDDPRVTIERLRKRYEFIADQFREAVQISDPHRIGPFLTSPSHDGSPHVEYEGRTLFYVRTERGSENERRATDDPDELLYWLVRDAASAAASDWELRHRREGEDSRRQWFQLEVELLAKVSNLWAGRARERHQEILREHPFRDD